MEQVNVVGSHKVVLHPDDGLVKRFFAVVVGRVQGDRTAQLGHSDLLPDVLVQAGEEDLLRCPGLRPSMREAMERTQSATAKWISSLLTKSEMDSSFALKSTRLPG
jgi:hypothetical protein